MQSPNLDIYKALFGSDPNVRFREETVGSRGFTIVSYMLADDNLWKEPFGKETRGITFDTETGLVASLPFEKFFNVGEKPETHPRIVSQEMEHWKAENYIADKLDGSMVTPALGKDGRVYMKTKKSFFSDVAILAQENLTPNMVRFCYYWLSLGKTPIFEFTHPRAKIVIDYGDTPTFTLLAIRDNFTMRYLHPMEYENLADSYNIDMATRQNVMSLENLQKISQMVVNKEGWVIYTPTHRYKIKTPWYLVRHRINTEIRVRDIAEHAVNETLDDIIAELIDAGINMAQVRDIERQVALWCGHIRTMAEDAIQGALEIPEGKERADWVKTRCEGAPWLKGLTFKGARGIEITDDMVKEVFTKNFLKQYFGLEPVERSHVEVG